MPIIEYNNSNKNYPFKTGSYINNDISFTVKNVIFQEEGSNYKVLSLESDNPLEINHQRLYSYTAILDTSLMIYRGMTLSGTALINEDKRYGTQLEFKEFSANMTSAKDMIKDLIVDMSDNEIDHETLYRFERELQLRGINDINDFLEMKQKPSSGIQHIISTMSEVHQIIGSKINDLVSKFYLYQKIENFLSTYNFKPEYVSNAIDFLIEDDTNRETKEGDNKYRNLTIKEKEDVIISNLKKNPYKMIEDRDIPFRYIDQFADRLGFRKDSDIRAAYIAFDTLYNNESQGNTWMSVSSLAKQTSERLGGVNKFGDINAVKKALSYLKYHNLMVHSSDNYVSRTLSFHFEQKIAKLIKEHGQNKVAENSIGNLNFEIDYTSSQIKGIDNAFNHKISIITGGPGTGKTTTVNGIVKTAQKLGYNDSDIVLLAPTGRAARRMKESTGHNAYTIHSFCGLGYELKFTNNNVEKYSDFINSHDKSSLKKIFIIDESSMLDNYICSLLLTIILERNKNATVVFIGDVDQLRSVSAGMVLKDLIDSNLVETVYLQQVHRRAIESGINELSNDIKNCEINSTYDLLVYDDPDNDIYAENVPSLSDHDIKNAILDRVKYLITTKNTKDIQVLSPMRKHTNILSTTNLNKDLKKLFNPNPKDTVVVNKNKELSVGDNIICRKNSSFKSVIKNPKKSNDVAVNNGDIGKIIEIERDAKNQCRNIIISTDEGDCIIPKRKLGSFDHAYAITVHQSQGSEYAHVVMPFTSSHDILLNKENPYTAITRSKDSVSLIGDIELAARVLNMEPEIRTTKLKEMILSDVVLKPVLPEYANSQSNREIHPDVYQQIKERNEPTLS